MEVMTRHEAKRRGLKKFFSGKPCKRGHVGLRHTDINACVECVKAYKRRLHAENRAEQNELRRERRFRNVVPSLLYAARRRAAARGLPFDLTESDIVIPPVCPVLGIPLTAGRGYHGPSIDRLRPEHGYVKGNVIVVSRRANLIRNDATLDELRAVLAFYERVLQPHKRD